MPTKSKLTLWVDADVVSFGKGWARERGRSLSEVVTEYLGRLRTLAAKERKATPLVRKMSGVLRGAPPEDLRSTYQEYLENRHGRV